MMIDNIEIIMQSRSPTIDDLVVECALGRLPFSGPDSLCAKVHMMGFTTTSLYEVVMKVKEELNINSC